MTNFIKGKIKQEVTTTDLFSTSCQPELVSGSNEMLKQVQHDTNIGVRNDKTLEFSEEATAFLMRVVNYGNTIMHKMA